MPITSITALLCSNCVMMKVNHAQVVRHTTPSMERLAAKRAAADSASSSSAAPAAIAAAAAGHIYANGGAAAAPATPTDGHSAGAKGR